MNARDSECCVLAIDVGTSSVRSALFDESGREQPATRARIGWRVRAPELGAAEVAPEALLRHASRCIDRTLDAAGKTRPVAGVGLCSFWHGLLGVDAALRPLTPVLTWADIRPDAVMGELARRFDRRRIHRRTGCPLHASYWPAKLAWLRRRHAGAFRQVRYWLSPTDFVLASLLGQLATSHSMASATGLYDQRRQGWALDLAEQVHVRAEQLPPIRELASTQRTLRPRWARRWPALRETLWVPGIGDGAASNLGAGCVAPGVAALMIGTSAAVRVAGEPRGGRLPEGLWRYRLERDEPLIGGAISNGGAVFDWLRRVLRLPEDFERRLVRFEPDAHGLTALPLLMGERTPVWRGDVSGLLAGLRASTGPLEIAHAFLEAVAIRCAAMVDLVDRAAGRPVRLIGTGNALRSSALWPRMIADAAGRALEISDVEEASLRGAAWAVLHELGLADRRRLQPHVQRVIQPDPARTAVYAAARRRAERLYRLHFEP